MYNWPKAKKIKNPKAYGNRWTQFNILQTFYLPQCSNKRAVQYIQRLEEDFKPLI